MKKIGIELVIKPNNGGSYQYWFTILNALGTLDKPEYEVFVIYNDESWNEIVNGFQFTRLTYIDRPRTFIIKLLEKMLWRFGTDFLQKVFAKTVHDYSLIRKEKLDLLFADSSLGIGNVLVTPVI